MVATAHPSVKCSSILLTSVTSISSIWTVGHELRSTPTNGHRFTAYGLPLAVTHPSTGRGRRDLTSVTESPSKQRSPTGTLLQQCCCLHSLTSRSSVWMLETVGHKLRSTPTNGHRFTAYGLPLVVTHPSTGRGRRCLTSVTESPSKQRSPLGTRQAQRALYRPILWAELNPTNHREAGMKLTN